MMLQLAPVLEVDTPKGRGHAEVLMSPLDGVWQAVSYVSYDATTGTLDYEWEDGFVSY